MTLLIALLFLSAGWESVESDHLRVYFAGDRSDAVYALRIGEEFLKEASERFGFEPGEGKIEIWICRDEDQFRRAVNAPIQDWAVGCAFPLQRRVMIRDPGFVEMRKLRFSVTLRHELAHVLIGAKLGRRFNRLPVWFHEGMAMLMSGEGMFFRRDLILMGNALWGRIIPLSSLERSFPEELGRAELAYAESLSAVSMIEREYGAEALRGIIELVGMGYSFVDAMTLALGTTPYSFDLKWQSYVKRRYKLALVLSSSSVVWGLISLSFLVAYILYRRARARKLEMMELEEAEDEFFK